MLVHSAHSLRRSVFTESANRVARRVFWGDPRPRRFGRLAAFERSGNRSQRDALAVAMLRDVQHSVQAGRWILRIMSYSESRARYAETLDAVANDHEEVVITRAGHESVVIVSLDDYQSLKETAYLLRSPENARRLVTAIERLEASHGIQRDLAE
jgi:antitoxin YefM